MLNKCSYSFASLLLVLIQFFERNLFLDSVLCSTLILSRERSSGFGFSRKRPSESVASLVRPTSTPTAFLGSFDGCSSTSDSSPRRLCGFYLKGKAWRTLETLGSLGTPCAELKWRSRFCLSRAFLFFLFFPRPTSLVSESFQPLWGCTKERYLCGFFFLGLFVSSPRRSAP